ncbi:MAG: twitch domain-containing radical SAM protein [Bacteroidales bacterium]
MKRNFEKYAYWLLPFYRFYNALKAGLIHYPEREKGYSPVPGKLMKAYNKHRFHGAKPLFCYNPFVNLFFNISGEAIACCRSHDNVLGTYPEQSIRDIWFGEKAERLRDHMRHNDLSMGCAYCEKQIKAHRFQGLPSMRADAYPYTKKDMYPKIMELELSNVCNLACLMCSGRESSKIRANREKLPPIRSPYDKAFVSQLESFIPRLKEMHFYGGEPFLIDIYYDIWDRVIDLNPKIKMTAVTNGTIYNKHIEQIILSSNFDLTISLDSLDKKRFEYIRKGADLSQVMDNIEKFNQLTDKHLTISHTPIKLNWQDTPDIVRFCNKIHARLNLSFAERPAKYALWSNHPDVLDDILAYYDSVEFKQDKHNFAAKYNIRVFNEWQEQLRYFRDKNQNILQRAGDIKTKEKALEEELIQKFKVVLGEIPDRAFDIDDGIRMLEDEILHKPASPAKNKAMGDLLGFLNDSDAMNSEAAHRVFQSTEKFRVSLSEMINEDEFWEQYY